MANNWDGIKSGQLGSQGAHLSWNRNGGSGRTCFANQQGGGHGGWEWVNYNSAGVQEPTGEPAMQLSREGGLYVRDNLVVGGNLTVTGKINISQYQYFQANWTGGMFRGSAIIQVYRTDKTVTLWFQRTYGGVNNPANPTTSFAQQLPEWARPTSRFTLAGEAILYTGTIWVTTKGNVLELARVVIYRDGGLHVIPQSNNWGIANAYCGWEATSITYPCDFGGY